MTPTHAQPAVPVRLAQPRPSPRLGPAFTLIEVSVTIIIIAMLTGLALHMANRAIRTARREGERQLLVALKNSITGFKSEFGFLPPLVDDANPIVSNQPSVIGNDAAGLAHLQGFTSSALWAPPLPVDDRYSIHSLPYYLMGLCDAGNVAVDGASGSQFTTPRPDGSFTRRGKAYDSFFDASTQARRIENQGSKLVAFDDRWNHPIRYYRWEPRAAIPGAPPGSIDASVRTLVPRPAGDPGANPKLRSARYALVSGGERGTFNEGPPIEVGSAPLGASPVDDASIVEVEE